MFRASASSGAKSELLILITPHILNQLELTPIHRIDREFHAPEDAQHPKGFGSKSTPFSQTASFPLSPKERP
jgi:hypothetical protein